MPARAKPKRTPAKTATPSGKPAKRAAATRAAKPAHKAVPKANGDAAVQDFLALLPGWQSDVGRRIDALVTREVPGVVKAIKWHSAMYGVAGQGWFASLGGFKSYVKLNFFDGARLKPMPPGGEGKTMRYVDIPGPDALDEAKLVVWVRQAAKLPGWGRVAA